MKKTIKIGTRGSQLALWQANWVKSAISDNDPLVNIEIVIIKTKGDKILDVPLAKIGGKGLFVKEIEESLLQGKIDIAVHSMKDMPAELPSGLCIGAVPEREIPNDVLISKSGIKIGQLTQGACIGTSSLRRSSQLKCNIPEIKIMPLRGNLDTRLKKLQTENLDAIVLAAAGVKRLGLEDKITEYIDTEMMLPAVGQGALCIEIRKNDPYITPIVSSLNHESTYTAVMGERAFLNYLGGSCQIPIAAYGIVQKEIFTLKGLVADIDGSAKIADTISGPKQFAENLGVDLAKKLISMGANKILEKIQPQEN